MLKGLVNKYLRYFSYFYRHLGYRVLIAFVLTGLVGLLDGFGIAMILPVIQMMGGSNEFDPDALGNMRFVTDFIASLGFKLEIKTVMLAMLVFFSLKGLARFADLYYMVRLRTYFIKKLRIDNIELFRRFSFKHFVLADSGRIQNTLSVEVGRIVTSFTNYFNMLQNVILVVVYFVLASLANLHLALFVALGGVLVNLVYRVFFKRSKKYSKEITDFGHGFQGLLIQMVGFFKYLKSTASIDQYSNRLKVKAEEIENARRKVGFINSVLEASREPLIMLLVTAIVLFQVLYFGQGLGPILLSLVLLYRALNSFMFVQVQWNAFLSGVAAIDNMEELMGEMQSHQEDFKPEKLKTFQHHIEVKDVCFSYAAERVLDHINLKITRNQTVAFVGQSGSGKTTLVNLISGLLVPESGAIIIDDQKLSDIDVRSFQKRIGYITQEPVIFDDSVFNNITLWSEKNAENISRFWNALKGASIDDFVKSLPEKENAPLGSNGVMVSGGQKQRLSIARELYKAVDIIIMDEATSALDSQTELTIQKNIENLKGNFTFLIVAHRLSTIRHADIIVMMNQGRVEAIGSFEELLSTSNHFKRMVELQEI